MPGYRGYRGYRRGYRRNYRRYRRTIAPTKKLVTGQTQPTFLEKIASGVGAAASVAKAVLPIVSAINTEMKYIDVVYTALGPLFGAPNINILSPITTGVLEQNRIGNSVLAKDFNIRYRITPNFTGNNLLQLRFILFVDKMQDGTPPTLAEIMQFPTSFESAFHKDYTDRFVILKDKRITLTNENMMQSQGKLFKKLDFHIRFKGATSAASDMGPNTLWMMWWTNSTANGPQIESYSRLNFTDN